MSYTVKWHGEHYPILITRELRRRLQKLGPVVADRVKRNISDPAPPHSFPGEFPHTLSGELIRSIVWYTEDPLRLVIEAGAPHAIMLEFGTDIMAARPFLRRTLAEMHSTIVSTMTAPVAKRFFFF